MSSTSIDFAALAKDLTYIKEKEEAVLAGAAMEAIATRVKSKMAWLNNATLNDITMPTTEDFSALTEEVVIATMESREIPREKYIEAAKLDGLSLTKVIKAASCAPIELIRAVKSVELFYITMIEYLDLLEYEATEKLGAFHPSMYPEDSMHADFDMLYELVGRIKSQRARAEASIALLREIFNAHVVDLSST